jgi:hypothetical protein
MFVPRLTCALALVLALFALSNRAELSIGTSTQDRQVCLASVGQTDYSLSFTDATPLDDEVEVPDEDEDDEPDDPGQALDLHGDGDSLSTVLDASNSDQHTLAVAARIFEGTSARWEQSRFLSFCRFRC